jgi:hypothetical protein
MEILHASANPGTSGGEQIRFRVNCQPNGFVRDSAAAKLERAEAVFNCTRTYTQGRLVSEFKLTPAAVETDIFSLCGGSGAW